MALPCVGNVVADIPAGMSQRDVNSINAWSAYGEAKIAQGLISVGVPEDEANDTHINGHGATASAHPEAGVAGANGHAHGPACGHGHAHGEGQAAGWGDISITSSVLALSGLPVP